MELGFQKCSLDTCLLCSTFSKVHISTTSFQNIIWTICTLEGRLLFHDTDPRSIPRGGAKGQNLGHL